MKYSEIKDLLDKYVTLKNRILYNHYKEKVEVYE